MDPTIELLAPPPSYEAVTLEKCSQRSSEEFHFRSMPERIRSTDIRTWLLVFAVVVCLGDIPDLIYTLPYHQFNYNSFAVGLQAIFDVFLLHAALTNGIVSLKVNRWITLSLLWVGICVFFLLFAATSAILFGFEDTSYRNLPTLRYDGHNEASSWAQQVRDSLTLTMMAAFHVFFLSIRHYLVNKTLKTVEIEHLLDDNYPIV